MNTVFLSGVVFYVKVSEEAQPLLWLFTLWSSYYVFTCSSFILLDENKCAKKQNIGRVKHPFF